MRNKLIYRWTVIILLVILVLPITLNAKEQDKSNKSDKKSKIDVIQVDGKDSTIVLKSTDKDKFSFKYDKKLFRVTSKINKNEITINITTQKNAKISMYDRVYVYVPKEKYKKLIVNCNKAGISLFPIDTDIDIKNTQGSVSFYVPKSFKHTINYTSEQGSGSVIFNKGANNYRFNLDQSNSAVSLSPHFKNYDKNETATYEYKKGKENAQVNIKVNNSSFSAEIK